MTAGHAGVVTPAWIRAEHHADQYGHADYPSNRAADTTLRRGRVSSSEQRLARALLLLAHHGQASTTHRVRPRISQQTLADIVGTTRSRVNFFLNKFKQRGYIEYSVGLKVNDSLTTVLLRNEPFRGRPSKTG